MKTQVFAITVGKTDKSFDMNVYIIYNLSKKEKIKNIDFNEKH